MTSLAVLSPLVVELVVPSLVEFAVVVEFLAVVVLSSSSEKLVSEVLSEMGLILGLDVALEDVDGLIRGLDL